MSIIGIDLGTTNSLGCVYEQGEVKLIPNSEGSFFTPSAVTMLDDGSVLVGAKAKERKITHPDRTALSFKKLMGTKQKIKLGKKEFLPEELSALVIRSIVDDAERFLGEKVTEAVISVPAYFHDKQRAATKRAGALAGVKVERILNEPSAAALSAFKDNGEDKHFLVFDFGGGTLDVSLVNCIDKIVEISAVAGNNHLGGDDFDELIAREFLKENGLEEKDLTKEEYATLVKKACKCKEDLSGDLLDTKESMIQIVISGQVYSSVYTNKRLIKESKPIINEIRKVIQRVLKDGKAHPGQIKDIIMVGGSSKMPIIQSYLRHIFHTQPTIRTDCDEAIALGLGTFCGIREKDRDMEGYMLTDVCPFSLGTSVLNKNDSNKNYMSMIIPRNSILPCSKEEIYTNSSDYQTKVHFTILQGEEMYAKDNTLLGSIDVKITPKPKNMEQIIARYTYDINGILIVDIKVPSTGKNYQKVLSESLSEGELKSRMEKLNKMRTDPKDLPENMELIEKLEQIHAEVSPEQKQAVIDMIDIFGKALSSGSPVGITRARRMIEKNLPKLDSWDPLAEFDLVLGMDEETWDDPWAEDEWDLTDDWSMTGDTADDTSGEKEDDKPFSLEDLFRFKKKEKKYLS